MNAAAALLAAAVLLSPSFVNRAAQLDSRITADQAQHLLAPGQMQMLQAQLGAARTANASGDPNAQAMLDVIDRELAEADHVLSRAENGGVLVVHTGDSVTIAMNDPYAYALDVSDRSILMLHAGVMWRRGVQGVFDARLPGTVTVTLQPKNAPPALANPVIFTVVVLQR